MIHKKEVFAFALSIILILCGTTPQKTFAEDTNSSAVTELQPNVSVEGQEQGNKIFSFTMPGKGYVRFILKNKDFSEQSSGCSLNLYQERSVSGELSKKIDQSWWVGMGSLYETQYTACLNFSPNVPIYLQLSVPESLTEEGRGVKYELKAEFYPDSSWETEPNDDIAHATPLAIGKARHGTGYYSYDQDFYSFIAPKNGTIKCSLSIADAEKIRNYDDYYALAHMKDDFSLELLDKAGKKIAENRNQSKNMSISFKVKKGKKYFVHVSPPGYYGIDALYKIRVAYKK